MPITSWRVTGLETFDGLDLELSELHLYDISGRVCAGAQISASHAPVGGQLTALGDDDLQSTCRFAGADATAPGFWVRWDLAVPKDVTRIRMAAGSALERACARLRIQALVGGIWIEMGGSVQETSGFDFVCSNTNAWYDEALPTGKVTGITGEISTESGTEVSTNIPSDALVGDLLLLFVMHRSALTVPVGWDLLATSPAISGGGVSSQWQSVLSKMKTIADVMSPVVVLKQATAGRLVTGVMAVNMQGVPPQIQVLSDKVSGDGRVQDVLPILVRPGGLGIASASEVAVAPGAWTAPAGYALVLGQSGNVGDRRLGVAYSLQPGMLSGAFAIPSDSAVVEKSRISLSIYPSDEQRVLKRVARKYSVSAINPRQVTGEPVFDTGSVTAVSPVKARDVEFGGRGFFYGVVKDHETNRALQRRVRLFRSRDGYLVAETWSASDGSYRFEGLNERYEYDIEAWDHEKNFFSVVANNQIPEVAA